MKTIIAGGRDNYLTSKDYTYLDTLEITEVVSGGARGIDTDGEIYAKARDIPLKIFPADWNRFGKSAGYRRNAEMAKYADSVVLFEGGKGTNHMYDIAVREGLLVHDRRG
jgi:hypothetical protein